MNFLWTDGTTPPSSEPLQEDVHTEMCVIGGGMAGVLCAAQLTAQGIDNVLLEARQVGEGITKGTTAVLTAQHGTLYRDIAKRYVPDGVSIWNGLWSCCKYAFASSAFALTMCCVEQPIETHKQSWLLAIFILILGGLLQAISCFTFLPFVDEVMNDPLPLVYVMNNYLSAAYPWIRSCYYILMLLAIVSSTIPATYMISSRYQAALKFIPALKTDDSRNIVAAILFMIICTLVGALGLTNLANTGLTIVSYIGMPLVVISLFFIWPQRTRKFRQAEREQAATEQIS